MDNLLSDFLDCKGFAIVLISNDGEVSNYIQMDNMTEIERIGFIDCAFNLADLVTDKSKELKESL